MPCFMFQQNILYKLKNNFHGCIALTLSDLYDTGVTAVAVLVLGSDLIEELVGLVNIEDLEHLATSMKLGGKILLDLLLNFFVNGNFLAVLNFLDALAVLVLLCNLCGYLNVLEIVLFLNCKSDKTFNDLLNFFSLGFGGDDLAVLNKSGNLAS